MLEMYLRDDSLNQYLLDLIILWTSVLLGPQDNASTYSHFATSSKGELSGHITASLLLKELRFQ